MLSLAGWGGVVRFLRCWYWGEGVGDCILGDGCGVAGALPGGVCRVVVASGFRLRAGCGVGLVFTGSWLRRVSGCGAGAQVRLGCTGSRSHWVPGCGPRVILGRCLQGVVALGAGLRAGGRIRLSCTGSWVGFPAAARGRIGLVCTGSMSCRFSDCGPGVESGQYVPGRGRVRFPVMAGGRVGSVFARSRSRRVSGCGPGVGSGRYVPDRGSGFRLRAGVKLGWYVPGYGRVGFRSWQGVWLGWCFQVEVASVFRRVVVAGCKCVVVNDNCITVVTGGQCWGLVKVRVGLRLGWGRSQGRGQG